jgi:uncharacterized phage protein (TIGR02218 family)
MVVTGVVSKNEFQVGTITDAPDIYLRLGTVTFTSGALEGKSFSAKSWVQATSTFVVLPLPRELILLGDTLTATAGCNKLWATCRDTFNNQYNFRGEHLTPTKDYIIKFPDAPT